MKLKEFFVFMLSIPSNLIFRGIRSVPLPNLGMGYFADFFKNAISMATQVHTVCKIKVSV